jgi:nucleotide-binding universal stress UspA family protein
MSYRDLLVHLDDSKGCARRIDAAVRLAAQHGAHLTGIYPIVEIPLLHYIREQIPPDLRASMAAEAQTLAERALEAFRQAAEARGVGHEGKIARALDTTLTSVLSMHARCVDLLVLGQVDPDERLHVAHQRPEEIVLSCGRPVLILPHDGAHATLGERILIGWDGSREAALVVNQAMPVLRRASSVHVVSADPESTAFGEGEASGADIGVHLARHEVKAEVKAIETGRMAVGDALLAFAEDHGCDLLVMGASARSRLRELVLGGATRTILKRMTLPVLMAH